MEWNDYSHFLITRFNVKIDSMKNKILDKPDICIDYDYLSKRFEIFEKYTVPSVLNQSCQNFKWIVMFNGNTPNEFKKKIKKMEKDKCFSPLFIFDDDDQKVKLNEFIMSAGKKQYIISRIDNDDALHKDYIKEIQNNIESYSDDEFIISFPNGIQYEATKGIIARYNFPSNHFITLCQKNVDKKLKNIFDYNHMELSNCFKILYLSEDKYLWLEIVHSTNITNRMHIKIRDIITNKNILYDYGVEKQLECRKIRTYCYAIFNGPINIARLIKMYGMKRIIKKIKDKLKRNGK